LKLGSAGFFCLAQDEQAFEQTGNTISEAISLRPEQVRCLIAARPVFGQGCFVGTVAPSLPVGNAERMPSVGSAAGMALAHALEGGGNREHAPTANGGRRATGGMTAREYLGNNCT
jgi:hypothetical protein